MAKNSTRIYEKISPFGDEAGAVNVIIETPKNCRNKYAFDVRTPAVAKLT